MSPTYANVADICKPHVRCGSPGRVVRSLVMRPFPRPCRATLIEVRAQKDRVPRLQSALETGRPACGDPGRTAGRDGFVVSMAEPGTQPVTFRAMFIEELRARREQMGLFHREFAEKAHVSLSSLNQSDA